MLSFKILTVNQLFVKINCEIQWSVSLPTNGMCKSCLAPALNVVVPKAKPSSAQVVVGIICTRRPRPNASHIHLLLFLLLAALQFGNDVGSKSRHSRLEVNGLKFRWSQWPITITSEASGSERVIGTANTTNCKAVLEPLDLAGCRVRLFRNMQMCKTCSWRWLSVRIKIV